MNKIIKDYLITRDIIKENKPYLDIFVEDIINNNISEFYLLLIMEEEELNYIKSIIRGHKLDMILNDTPHKIN